MMDGGRIIQLPNPHQGQRAILLSPARFKWLGAGRRWRKTTLAMQAAVEGALGGSIILWGAPTFDQCRIGWGEMKHAAGDVADFNLGRMEVAFPTNGKVVFRSLDNPDNARGHTAHGIIIDEAPMVKARAWYEVLRPIISDTGGWALMQGTPKGRNWFWREWMGAADDTDSAAWSIPTLGVEIREGQLVRKPNPLENPDFPFAEAVRMHRTLPERIFRQEFLAEFIDDAGGVFRGVVGAAIAEAQGAAIPDHQYLFGVDWGKHNDFTVIAVRDLTTNEMVALDRFNQIDYTFQLGRLEALYDKFKPSRIIAEQNSMGVPLIEQLQRRGLPVTPFVTTNATKMTAIENLSLAFERGDIKIIPDPTLIGELQAYEAQRMPSGALRYSAPEGMHDDTVMALALAWNDEGHWYLWSGED